MKFDKSIIDISIKNNIFWAYNKKIAIIILDNNFKISSILEKKR